MPYHVPVSAHPLWQDPPFVLLLIWLAAAIGHRVLRWLRVDLTLTTRLEHGVLAAALGVGLLQYLAFTLGMLGALTPRNLWIGLLLLLVGFARDLRHVAIGILSAARQFSWAAVPGWMRVALVLIGIGALPSLLVALCPPVDPDSLYYHLTAPKRWLQMGSLGYLPTLMHTNMPMGVQMLFTLALGVWSENAAILIHFALGMLAFAAIAALGARLHSPAMGFAALFLFLIGIPPQNYPLQLASQAYVDLGLCLQVTCALLAWVLWSRSRNNGLLVCAALCAGFAATVKMTVALSGFTLALLTFLAYRREGASSREALFITCRFAAISLLPLLPWMLRAWHLTGNPVYPVLAGVFPTRDWSPAAGKALERYFRYYVWGTGGAGVHSDGRRKLMLLAAFAGVAGGAGIWLWRDRNPVTRALILSAGLLCLVCIWSTGLYLRYFLPFLPLAYVAFCAKIGDRVERSRPARVALVLTLALALLPSMIARLGIVRYVLPIALGSASRVDYIGTHFPPLPLWRYINTHLSPDTRILLVAGRPSYYLEPYCYVSEAAYQNCIRMDTWEHYVQDLRREKITYVIVPAELNAYSLGFDYAPTLTERPFAARLVAQYGHKVAYSAPDTLYQLQPLPDTVRAEPTNNAALRLPHSKVAAKR